MEAGKKSEPAPFEFTRMSFLVEVTPLRASTLGQLLTGVTLAPELSIFYHLHQRFFRHPTGLPEFPNDFAAWADSALGDAVLAERLANLNLFRSVDLSAVRREISVTVAQHMEQKTEERCTRPGSDFLFCQPRLVVFSSGLRALTPAQFVEILRTLDSDSIGYHLFAPKISPGPVANDFADWFRVSGYDSLGRQLDAFDPYLNSLEDNRGYLIELIERVLQSPAAENTHD